MLPELIIRLLSNHRQPHQTELPQPLMLHQIATLICHSLPPQENAVSARVETALRELRAQGEVLAGTGNQFCMAPPIVLAEDEINLTGLLFRGDRAYLRLAHQVLETGQKPSIQSNLHPKIHGFHRIKDRLRNVGIRLLTVANSLNHLPTPKLPRPSMLQSFERHNPFQTVHWTETIHQYVPQLEKQQTERWLTMTETNLRESTLLKLPTGEFLWFQTGRFYELNPDAALLAMFQLDQASNFQLHIPWDEAPGRLNLQGISLPGNHAQLLWRLSQPDLDTPRTRLFVPTNRPIAREVLTGLGCTLV